MIARKGNLNPQKSNLGFFFFILTTSAAQLMQATLLLSEQLFTVNEEAKLHFEDFARHTCNEREAAWSLWVRDKPVGGDTSSDAHQGTDHRPRQ